MGTLAYGAAEGAFDRANLAEEHAAFEGADVDMKVR